MNVFIGARGFFCKLNLEPTSLRIPEIADPSLIGVLDVREAPIPDFGVPGMDELSSSIVIDQ